MKFIAIIPARYQSTRFPGKPLAMLGEKPLIRWVYDNVSLAVEHTWVATDDDRIFDAVEAFGGKAIKTFSGHTTGTDRCAEAALTLEQIVDFDVVINVQGDEPFITKEQIEQLQSCFDDDSQIATLVKEIESADELFNPNRPKVVIDASQNALYFSRSAIPFLRKEPMNNWLSYHRFWAHIGMYAFRKKTLQEITRLVPGKLEQAESLEQLRWLEHGYRIKTAVTAFHSMGIDSPEDLKTASEYLIK